MMYRSKVVWCLCLLLAGLAVVAVVPRVVHAETICNACKGTGKILEMQTECPVRVQEEVTIGYNIRRWPDGKVKGKDPITERQYVHPSYCQKCNGSGVIYPECKYCGGTGVIYSAAEKEAMRKAEAEQAKQAEAERAKQTVVFEEKRVRLVNAVRATLASIGTFTDSRDGKSYLKLTVGSQTWMGENLNYNAAGSKCYGNNENNCAKYGRLYDWSTAKNACPAGFRLPSDAEWTTLTDYVVGDYAGGSKTAGKILKSTNGWKNDGGGVDFFKFSALPGGFGGGGEIGDGVGDDVGAGGSWWSATEYDAGRAWIRSMTWRDDNVVRSYRGKYDQFSVRCVQGVDEAKERIKEAEPVRQSYGASIVIGTMPAKAEIYIGGKLIGKSNEGKLQVPVGTYQVKFVKDGIEKTMTMTFQLGENSTMFVPLK